MAVDVESDSPLAFYLAARTLRDRIYSERTDLSLPIDRDEFTDRVLGPAAVELLDEYEIESRAEVRLLESAAAVVDLQDVGEKVEDGHWSDVSGDLLPESEEDEEPRLSVVLFGAGEANVHVLVQAIIGLFEFSEKQASEAIRRLAGEKIGAYFLDKRVPESEARAKARILDELGAVVGLTEGVWRDGPLSVRDYERPIELVNPPATTKVRRCLGCKRESTHLSDEFCEECACFMVDVEETAGEGSEK